MRDADIRHFAAIAGRVLDEVTGQPIRGALVALETGPASFEARRTIWRQRVGALPRLSGGEFDQIVTSGDGHFHFLDLSNGRYTIRASARDGATSASAEVTVTREPREVKKPEQVDLKLRFPASAESAEAQPLRPKLERRTRFKAKSS